MELYRYVRSSSFFPQKKNENHKRRAIRVLIGYRLCRGAEFTWGKKELIREMDVLWAVRADIEGAGGRSLSAQSPLGYC